MLSLLLTLVATPVFYSLFDDAQGRLRARVRRWLPGGRGFEPASSAGTDR